MTHQDQVKTLWTLLGEYSIIIPRVQRDYAQGRCTGQTPRIRRRFLEAIYQAATESVPLSLDFVYGEMKPGARLELLDGQQRLTTLFLLHWYAAVQEGGLTEDVTQCLKKFTYEIRASSRDFCEKLSGFDPGKIEGPGKISEIICDQPWYVPYWKNDPGISGMLVMLDDIAEKFNKTPLWERLISSEEPLIYFHFQKLSEFGLSDDLYIKMNSRGKELTEYENAKACLLLVMQDKAPPQLLDRFVTNIDTQWADLFWAEYKKVDQPLGNYLSFLLRCIRVWQGETIDLNEDQPLEAAGDLIKGQNPIFKDEPFGNLHFILEALDCWSRRSGSMKKYFQEIFGQDKLRLFDEKIDLASLENQVDLMELCCLKGLKAMNLGQHLLLFAVVVHLVGKTDDFDSRLRILRNLLVNSKDELRVDYLPRQLGLTYRLICEGIPALRQDKTEPGGSFNQQQIDEEITKQDYIDANASSEPIIRALENHLLVRGRLAAFYDGQNFPKAKTLASFRDKFYLLLPENRLDDPDYLETVNKAFLATGDYSQCYDRNNDRHLFVTDNPRTWHGLLSAPRVAPKREGFERTQEVLCDLLERIADCDSEEKVESRLVEIVESFLAKCEGEKNFLWRYYFVKYPAMRDGNSGYYVWYSDYDVRMLDKERLSSYHRDPYVWAAVVEVLGEKAYLDEHNIENLWFMGYDKQGAKIPKGGYLFCGEDCWELKPLPGPPSGALKGIKAKHKVLESGQLKIRQVKDEDGYPYDKVDRIKKAAALIKDILG